MNENDWSVQSLEDRDGTWRHAPLWQQHILRATKTALLARPDMPAGQLIHEIITNHTEKRSSFKSFVVCCTLFISGFLLCDIDIAGCACELRVKLWVASFPMQHSCLWLDFSHVHWLRSSMRQDCKLYDWKCSYVHFLKSQENLLFCVVKFYCNSSRSQLMMLFV